MYLIPKRICALYKIKSIPSRQKIKFKRKEFKFHFDIKPSLILQDHLEINSWSNSRNIPNNISIFKGKVGWGTVLMGRSIIEITQSDYNYLEKEMRKNASI